jgi:hypothetical protein
MSTAGGIIWSVSATAAIAAELALAKAQQAAQNNATLSQAQQQETSTAYRPTEWSQPATTVIAEPGTAPVNGGSAAAINSSGGVPITNGNYSVDATTTQATSAQVYVFDAVFRIEHSQQLRATEHPTQSGASISDHAMLLPAKVVMEIGMSDVMDHFTPGTFTGGPSKSVNAYQTIVAVQQRRKPLTVTTRLATYTNMLIEDIRTSDTKETKTGLKATITFIQIFNGTVTQQTVSARPQTTDSTSIGAKQALPISSTDLKRFTTPLPTTVPGAGDISSRTTNDGS